MGVLNPNMDFFYFVRPLLESSKLPKLVMLEVCVLRELLVLDVEKSSLYTKRPVDSINDVTTVYVYWIIQCNVRNIFGYYFVSIYRRSP